jgi:hypothetical protein
VNTALVAIDDGEHIRGFLKLMDRPLGGTLSSFEAYSDLETDSVPVFIVLCRVSRSRADDNQKYQY